MVAVQTAIWVGALFSLGLGLAIIVAIHYAIPVDSKSPQDSKRHREHIKRLLRDEEGFPSLSRIQFFAWTVVIVFCFSWIYFVRLANGVLALPPSIPTDILALMGVSVGATVASTGVSNLSNYKKNVAAYKSALDDERTKAKTAGQPAPPIVEDLWGTMFLEHGNASLGRVQMFAWTVLSIAIYSVLVAITMMNLWSAASATALVLPDVDPSLLILMGISQAGYLGSKVAVGAAAK